MICCFFELSCEFKSCSSYIMGDPTLTIVYLFWYIRQADCFGYSAPQGGCTLFSMSFPVYDILILRADGFLVRFGKISATADGSLLVVGAEIF